MLTFNFVKIVTVNFLLFTNSPSNQCEECHLAYKDSLKSSVHRTLECKDCHLNFELYPHPEKVSEDLCFSCHPGEVRIFKNSIHYGKIECQDCHGFHNVRSFEDVLGTKLFIDRTCGECHKNQEKDYKRSIHYIALKRGVGEAPSCSNCHTEHSVLPPASPGSRVYPQNIPKTCAHCHENRILTDKYGIPSGRYSTYVESFHGVYLKGGILYSANCVSCHRSHFILPATHPLSSIHPDNLPRTCGKCHPKASWNVTKGKIHVEVKREVSPGVFAVRVFYILFISILLFFFVLHITLEFLRRFKKEKEL